MLRVPDDSSTGDSTHASSWTGAVGHPRISRSFVCYLLELICLHCLGSMLLSFFLSQVLGALARIILIVFFYIVEPKLEMLFHVFIVHMFLLVGCENSWVFTSSLDSVDSTGCRK